MSFEEGESRTVTKRLREELQKFWGHGTKGPATQVGESGVGNGQ